MFCPIVTTTFAHLFHTLVWLRPDIIKGGWREVAKISMFLRMCQIATFAFTMGTYRASMTYWQMKALFIIVGQALNMSVYHKLGLEGVYYGNLYNKNLPIVKDWPFNSLRDPQYVGAMLTHQGVFLFYPYLECFGIHLYSMLWFVATSYIEQVPSLKTKDS